MGYVTDKLVGFRFSIPVCLALMAVGNLLYFLASAFTYEVDRDDSSSSGYGPNGHWVLTSESFSSVGAVGRWTLIGSRVVGGFGSSTVSLANAYIIQATADSEKTMATNRVRLCGFLGGFLGVTVGTATLRIPFNDLASPYQLDSVTVPALVALALQVVVASIAIFALKGENMPKPKPVEGDFFTWQSPELRTALLLNVLGALHTFAMFILFAQLTILSFFYYEVADSISSLWRTYIPFIVGSLVGTLSVRIIGRRGLLTTRQLVLFSPIVCVVGLLVLFGFFPDKRYTITFYYIGFAIFFAANNIYATAYRAFYSVFADRTSYTSMLLGWLFINSGIGAFVGSAIGGLILSFGGDSSGTGCCTKEDQSCCGVQGVDVMIGTCALSLAVVAVIQYFFLPSDGEYESIPDKANSSDEERPFRVN